MKITGLSRVSKDRIIQELAQEAQKHPIFFIIQQGTVPASTMDKLRARLRTGGSRYWVVKNRLGRIAFERANQAAFSSAFSGASAVYFTSGDAVSSCKILVDFAKENEGFKIRTGCLNGRTLSAEDIRALANLPARPVLIAKAVGAIQAPIARLMGVLSGTIRKVVTVLDAVAKKKGSG